MARRSFRITALQRRLGDTVAERLKGFARREWFLTALLVLYLALILNDRSLPRRTPDLVDWGSLALITSLILVSKGLELSGIFTRLSIRLISLSGGSERKLMLLLIPTIAFSSAVIMNDTAMLVFIPLVIITSRLAGINTARAVTLSAIAANVGSALTPIGNPQNIIIWNTYGPSFVEFTGAMLPFVVLWLVILLLFTATIGDRRPSVEKLPPIAIRKRLLLASLSLLIADVALAEIGKSLWTLPLTLAVLLALGREALLGFDWALVLTFAFIFADFGEVARLISGHSVPSEGLTLFLASAGLSQLISNVPATVVFLSSGRPEWLPLALGVNLGGTGIITGSLANLIALRISGIGMRDFHRFSIPYFLVALGISILVLLI
ncbi:SLC13 family permease [Thermococcus sp. 21S7]|uniref:SLC13 family permease n=1 Tax=Thermococcus sp. 21S7 TaxID=1638221 RepID=UPI00143A4854|nr:SLC13 family permease [Thermococcus sp. 21S7]NJE61173.1 anion transporter [Thermococcus sp. 21S7]